MAPKKGQALAWACEGYAVLVRTACGACGAGADASLTTCSLPQGFCLVAWPMVARVTILDGRARLQLEPAAASELSRSPAALAALAAETPGLERTPARA